MPTRRKAPQLGDADPNVAESSIPGLGSNQHRFRFTTEAESNRQLNSQRVLECQRASQIDAAAMLGPWILWPESWQERALWRRLDFFPCDQSRMARFSGDLLDDWNRDWPIALPGSKSSATCNGRAAETLMPPGLTLPICPGTCCKPPIAQSQFLCRSPVPWGCQVYE
jgi:hypothetical protein